DGRQDDGTIWIQRGFDVEPREDYRVQLSFYLWSESESFNTLANVAAFAGTPAPTLEADFDTRQAANQSAGWRRYNYAFNVRSRGDGNIWVALGISAVWETELTYYID